MSVISILLTSLLSLSFAAPAVKTKSPVSNKRISKLAPMAPSARRGIASVACTEASCLCEEVKKLASTCSEKVSDVNDDSNRKQLRLVQVEIATKRRLILEQGKTCSAFPAVETCFERSIKKMTQKNPRQRDIKNENSAELLGFGTDILIKLGNQPARSPAASR